MFQLDVKSSRSIYEQVIDNIKELIMTDVLTEGSKLPSVRELSRQLTINPNTVQKAFRELERENYVYTITGRGTFVSPKSEVVVSPERISEIQERIRAQVRELFYLGLSHDQARELAHRAIDSMKNAGEGE